MSAIWGALSLDGKRLPEGLAERMKAPYEACVIDAFGVHQSPDAMMGCGIQYITPEARQETLPIVDSERQLLFTADILLDNREELLSMLGWEGRETAPDGAIAFEMVRRYGEDCLNDLLGAYSLVWYDSASRQAVMVSDATGNRCLYYAIRDQVLYFSTLLSPLVAIAGGRGVNGRWITDFLARDTFAVCTEFEETAYSGIFRLAPRQVVRVSEAGLTKRLYWDPDRSELHLPNDRAYADRLKEIFRESTRCLLRAEKTSLLLSGGLDSTAIACYAGRHLRDRGQALYTYTSVPLEEFTPELEAGRFGDESALVLKTKTYLEAQGCQLECAFIDLAGKNIWDDRLWHRKIMEIPYKSMQNLLWVYESLERAYNDGSRIMLEGSYGNTALSLDGMEMFLYDLIRRKRLLTYLRQCAWLGRKGGMRLRQILRGARATYRQYHRADKIDNSDAALLKGSLVSREHLDDYRVRERIMQRAALMREWEKDYQRYRSDNLVNDLIFCQKGEIGTKHSLYSGVVKRDPTMDKRLIEFCVRLPANQFARNGVSRRLVREYLAEEMPAHVMSPYERGLQSADVVMRLKPHWARIHRELRSIYEANAASPYVDSARALETLEEIADRPETAESFTIMRLCYTALTLEFAQQVE